jgi:2-polyprenyl-3-methyl-5-hydroxy-6-metoxy-1,4-benzoquinol methylase
MNESQRQGVIDNARYLRQVRPIDPEEIQEYVPGQPHPAAVRQVLREEASALGLVERDDGTFEPVPEGRVSVSPRPVERLPRAHARRLDDLLAERFGPDWHSGATGERLRHRIREVKRRYLEGASVEYDEVTALAYAVYHLPATYASATCRLAALGAAGHLPRNIRLLDVGAGVGGQALALCDLLPADALVDYHAVEPSPAADVLEAMLADTGPNVHLSVHREPVESFSPDGVFDVVLCANVLSELDDPAAVAVDLFDALSQEGDLLAIAPADRQTAVDLREVERHVEAEAGATVYGPTVRLWPGKTPASTCWSFDREPALAVPGVQERLDAAGAGDGEFVNADVRYAYSVLRRDGETSVDVRPRADRFAPMADVERHVTERIDLVAVKLSHDLALSGQAATAGGGGTVGRAGGGSGSGSADGGETDTADSNPVFLVGDGSEPVDHFAVLTRPSTLNDDLAAAAYGQAVIFENALVLWNDDEDAYNLVVDGETVVDAVPQ